MRISDHLNRKRRLRQAIEEQRDRLQRMALAWTQSPAAADTLTREAVKRELRDAPASCDAAQLRVRLFAALSACWHRQRATAGATTFGAASANHDRTQPAGSRSARVRAEIGRLPVAERQVFTLINIEQLSYEQTARALAMPMNEVLRCLNRARQRLLDRLAQEVCQQGRCEACWCGREPAQGASEHSSGGRTGGQPNGL